MEEAWELAVVTSGESQIVKTGRVKYNDLQDVTYAANTKFELVALTSVAVSYLDLACNSSIFGLRFEALNERYIEVGFVFAALALGVNYWLRYLDEGKILSNIERDLEDLKNKLSTSISDISESFENQNVVEIVQKNTDELKHLISSIDTVANKEILNLSKTAEKFNLAIVKYDKSQKKANNLQNMPADLDPHGLAVADASIYESEASMHKEEFEGIVRELKQETRSIHSLSGKLKASLLKIQKNRKSLQPVLEQPKRLEAQLNELSDQLDTISTDLVKTEIKPARAKLRIVLFMMIWPWMLAFFVVASFIYALKTQAHTPCVKAKDTVCYGVQI